MLKRNSWPRFRPAGSPPRGARRIILLATLLLALAGPARAGDDWAYVLPEPGSAEAKAVYPVHQALFLSTAKPEDLREAVEYRGKVRRYTQWRFGSPNSIRVALVVDELDDGTVDLYVDSNRSRVIEKRDRLAGAGPDWEVPLDVAIVREDEVDLHERHVSIHRGATGRTLAVATLGFMEGTVALEGGTVAARRVDGDANGTFADAGDRLWIDKNADVTWDPFTEQMLFGSILRIDAQRYTARSDTLGHRLTLEPLTGTGNVKLVLRTNAEAVEAAEVAVTLVGRDGSAVLISGAGREVEVPSGEYRAQMLYLSIQGKDDPRRWNFQFSADDRRPRPWREVKTGETLEIDPVGTLDLAVEIEGDKRAARPGDTLTVLPRLYTGDGLLINACYWGADFGSEANHSKAAVCLTPAGGDERDAPALVECTSGFA